MLYTKNSHKYKDKAMLKVTQWKKDELCKH